MKLSVTATLFVFALFFGLQCGHLEASEEGRGTDAFSKFGEYSKQTRHTVDHSPWSDFLRSAVYDIGPPDRRAAPRIGSQGKTGTRNSTASKSRYRYEGNRVLFRFFDDGSRQYVKNYRIGLESLFERIDYADLSREEQLAYWFNLYNCVMIDEIAQRHPVSKPRKMRVNKSDANNFFDEKIITVDSVSLSLNDIRFNIVYRFWNDPYIVYGMWDGAIGGPSIQTTAFEGGSVSLQIRQIARRYVNSLRGVNESNGRLRVSQIYFDAKHLFPKWPEDLIGHLLESANEEVSAIILNHHDQIRAIRFDTHTANLVSGETTNFGGSDNPGAFAGSLMLDPFGQRVLSSEALSNGLPSDSLEFLARTEERRGRRETEVTITDIPTPNEGDQQRRAEEEKDAPAELDETDTNEEGLP